MRFKFLLFLVVSAIAFYSSVVISEEYPVNEKDRGLILPKFYGEVTIGPAWLVGNERRNKEVNFNFRYAISENFEFSRLGIRFRFLNQKNLQWAFRLQNFGLGKNTDGEFFHHTEFGIDGKQQLNKTVASLYNFGYFWSDSHEKDGKTSEYRAGVGFITKITTKSALHVGYSRRYFSGFGISSANLVESKFTYNFKSSLDGFLIFRISDFNEAVDSVLFNESYEKMFSIGVNWRF